MRSAREILASSSVHLERLSGHVFDVLSVSKPISPDAAVNLSKVVSSVAIVGKSH